MCKVRRSEERKIKSIYDVISDDSTILWALKTERSPYPCPKGPYTVLDIHEHPFSCGKNDDGSEISEKWPSLIIDEPLVEYIGS